MALISVAGWTRQLTRSRKKRSWTEAQVDKGQHKVKIVSNVSSGTGTDLPARTPSPLTMEGKTQGTGLGERASQVMDGVDQRLPVFSVNARRKFFHALAVVMFVPGIIIDVSRVGAGSSFL
jgi:dolichol kinase